jgi:hypothetical protein
MTTNDSTLEAGSIRGGSILTLDKDLVRSTQGMELLEDFSVRFLAIRPHHRHGNTAGREQDLWDGFLLTHPLTSQLLNMVTIPLRHYLRFTGDDWRVLVHSPTTLDIGSSKYECQLDDATFGELVARIGSIDEERPYKAFDIPLLRAYERLALTLKVAARWKLAAAEKAASEPADPNELDLLGTESTEVSPGSVVIFKDGHFANHPLFELIELLPFRFLAVERMSETENSVDRPQYWKGYLIAPPIAQGTIRGSTRSLYALLRNNALRDWTIVTSRPTALNVAGGEVIGCISAKALRLLHENSLKVPLRVKKGTYSRYPRLASKLWFEARWSGAIE